MAFIVKKRVDLSSLGTGWEEAYLEFIAPTIREARELPKAKDLEAAGFDIMESHFLEGKAWDGSALSPVTKDNFLDLPVDALALAAESFAGKVSPN